MKVIYFIVFIWAVFCLQSCDEKEVEEMYANVHIKFIPADSTIIFEKFDEGKLEITDMNYIGQGKIKYHCHGDTTLRVVKSYYDISYDGNIFFRQGENDFMQRKQFRPTGNYQVVLIKDTTIVVPLNPMY